MEPREPISSGLRVTNITISTQSYNIPSPNEMEVDAPEYVDVSSIADRDSVAIITPETADQDAETLQDLPLANDCMFPLPTPTTVWLILAAFTLLISPRLPRFS